MFKPSELIAITLMAAICLSGGWKAKAAYDQEVKYRYKAAMYDQGECGVDQLAMQLHNEAATIKAPLPFNKDKVHVKN